MTTLTKAQPCNFINLSGKRFGKWTVVDRAANRGDHSYWNCVCDCGMQSKIRSDNLRSNHSIQCQSCKAEAIKAARTIHGKRYTKAYRDWCDMKTRCLNPNSKDYKNYGGRGIKIYPEWIDDFVAYDVWCKKNLGPYPGKGWTRDRIDNDGHYWPGNLRWATYKQQANNKRKYAA